MTRHLQAAVDRQLATDDLVFMIVTHPQPGPGYLTNTQAPFHFLTSENILSHFCTFYFDIFCTFLISGSLFSSQTRLHSH